MPNMPSDIDKRTKKNVCLKCTEFQVIILGTNRLKKLCSFLILVIYEITWILLNTKLTTKNI